MERWAIAGSAGRTTSGWRTPTPPGRLRGRGRERATRDRGGGALRRRGDDRQGALRARPRGVWTSRFGEGVEHGRQAAALLERAGERWCSASPTSGSGSTCSSWGSSTSPWMPSPAVAPLVKRSGIPGFRAMPPGPPVTTSRPEATRRPVSTSACGRWSCRRTRSTPPSRPPGWALPTESTGSSTWRSPTSSGRSRRCMSTRTRDSSAGTRGGCARHTFAVATSSGRGARPRGLGYQRRDQGEWSTGVAQRALGRIAHAADDAREAESHLRQGLQIFASIKAWFDVAVTRMDLPSTLSARDGGRGGVAPRRGPRHPRPPPRPEVPGAGGAAGRRARHAHGQGDDHGRRGGRRPARERRRRLRRLIRSATRDGLPSPSPPIARHRSSAGGDDVAGSRRIRASGGPVAQVQAASRSRRRRNGP